MNDKNKAPDQGLGLSAIYLCIAGVIILWAWNKVILYYHQHPIKCYLILGVVGLALVGILYSIGRNKWIENNAKKKLKGNSESDFSIGFDINSNQPIYLSDDDRTTHMQVIGTTKSGKTAFVVDPIIHYDIAKGNGCFVIDGKSDQGFSNSISRYAAESKRGDFATLSLVDPKNSGSYNPFEWGGPDLITERFFSAFKFENEYYRSIQYNTLKTVLGCLDKLKVVPTAEVLWSYIKSVDDMKALAGECENFRNKSLKEALTNCYSDAAKYQESHSGLVAALSYFCTSPETKKLLNKKKSTISIKDIFDNRMVFYVRIPTLQYQTLGPAIGRMMLLELMQVASSAQVSGKVPKKIMSLVLDDFNDFIFEGFGSMVNKVRSANVGVVFSHQSLGDLDRVSPEFRNVVMTNTNIKVILKTPDPDSAEMLAKFLGTRETEKSTERVSGGRFGFVERTGDSSVRTTEEFLFHPNLIKTGLSVGEAIVLRPTVISSQAIRVQLVPVNERNYQDGK